MNYENYYENLIGATIGFSNGREIIIATEEENTRRMQLIMEREAAHRISFSFSNWDQEATRTVVKSQVSVDFSQVAYLIVGNEPYDPDQEVK